MHQEVLVEAVQNKVEKVKQAKAKTAHLTASKAKKREKWD